MTANLSQAKTHFNLILSNMPDNAYVLWNFGHKKAGIYPSFFYLIYSNDKHLFCLHYLHLFSIPAIFFFISIFLSTLLFTLSTLRLYPNFLPLCFYSIIWKYLSASIIASLFHQLLVALLPCFLHLLCLIPTYPILP